MLPLAAGIYSHECSYAWVHGPDALNWVVGLIFSLDP